MRAAHAGGCGGLLGRRPAPLAATAPPAAPTSGTAGALFHKQSPHTARAPALAAAEWVGAVGQAVPPRRRQVVPAAEEIDVLLAGLPVTRGWSNKEAVWDEPGRPTDLLQRIEQEADADALVCAVTASASEVRCLTHSLLHCGATGTFSISPDLVKPRAGIVTNGKQS